MRAFPSTFDCREAHTNKVKDRADGKEDDEKCLYHTSESEVSIRGIGMVILGGCAFLPFTMARQR